MSPALRAELQALLAATVSSGVSQRQIAFGAGVKQPMVSLAMHGSLIAKTANIEKLFEYLRRMPDVAPAWDKDTVPPPAPRLADVLAKLSDGSPDGDARLANLLEAVAALRPAKRG